MYLNDISFSSNIVNSGDDYCRFKRVIYNLEIKITRELEEVIKNTIPPIVIPHPDCTRKLNIKYDSPDYVNVYIINTDLNLQIACQFNCPMPLQPLNYLQTFPLTVYDIPHSFLNSTNHVYIQSVESVFHKAI